MNNSETAVNKFNDGYNCAQTVIVGTGAKLQKITGIKLQVPA